MPHQKRSFFSMQPGRTGIVVFLTALAWSGLATATSPAAWSAHDKAVAQSCVKASSLKQARAVGQPLVFDDRTALTALLLSGRYPQPHMENRTGQELCLFNRKTRRAVVTPADQLSVAAPVAPIAPSPK